MKVDRRTTLRLLAAAGASAQRAASQAPAPQPPSAGSDLQAAREGLRDDAQRIATVKLPRATEPAFHFRA